MNTELHEILLKNHSRCKMIFINRGNNLISDIESWKFKIIKINSFNYENESVIVEFEKDNTICYVCFYGTYSSFSGDIYQGFKFVKPVKKTTTVWEPT